MASASTYGHQERQCRWSCRARFESVAQTAVVDSVGHDTVARYILSLLCLIYAKKFWTKYSENESRCWVLPTVGCWQPAPCGPTCSAALVSARHGRWYRPLPVSTPIVALIRSWSSNSLLWYFRVLLYRVVILLLFIETDLVQIDAEFDLELIDWTLHRLKCL